MRIGVALLLVLLLSACGSSNAKPETPLHVSTFELKSTLLGKQLDQVLVTPQGGGKGRPLIVFLHGYGGTPADTLSPALVAALRRLGDRAPAVVLPDGQVGWWHDRDEGRWGSYVLALRRAGLDRRRRPGRAQAGRRAARPRTTSPRRGRQLPRVAGEPRRRLLEPALRPVRAVLRRRV